MRLDQSASLDSAKRFTSAIESLQPILLRSLSPSTESVIAIQSWSISCTKVALQRFRENRNHYFSKPDATPYLGVASRHMYKFIRDRLEVPFLREDTIRGTESEPLDSQDTVIHDPLTIGSLMTTIYQSIRSGELYSVVVDCFEEVAH